jgi:hypothetical protein
MVKSSQESSKGRTFGISAPLTHSSMYEMYEVDVGAEKIHG